MKMQFLCIGIIIILLLVSGCKQRNLAGYVTAQTECQQHGGICNTSCSDGYVAVTYSCDIEGGTTTTQAGGGSSPIHI